MAHRRLAHAVAVAFAAIGLPTAVLAVEDVTQCGARYSGPGVLTGDLDCSGPAYGIVIDQNGSLDLGGFHYTGGILCDAEPATGDGAAEYAPRACSIIGPGILSGAVHADSALAVTNVTVVGSVHAYKRVVVSGSDFQDAQPPFGWPTGWWAPGYCIRVGSTAGGRSYPPRSSVSDTTLDGCGMSAEKLGIKRTTISGAAEFGVRTGVARLDSTMITGSGAAGVAGEALKIFDSTISASGGAGVYLSSLSDTVRANLRMKRSTVSNNLDGALGAGGDINLGTLHGMNIAVSQSTISGNARFGLASDLGTVTAVRSQVRGNGTDATCGTSQACADLAASVAPRVSSAAACDTSYVAGSGIPGADWDICALD